MAIKFSAAVRDAQNDVIESTISTTPKLQLWSGTIPANCAAADAGDGDLLCEMDLPSDWMGASGAVTPGVKSLAGSWSDIGTAAAGAGTDVTHFRLYNSAGSVCHIQGTVSVTGGAGDMTMDNINVALAQVVTVNTFTLTAGNA